MLYLSNAFSLNMIPCLQTGHIGLPARITIVPELIADLRECLATTPWTSAIGHESTSTILSHILQLPVPTNRITLLLEPADTLIIAQYFGPRLPEGATELPPNCFFRFYKVTTEQFQNWNSFSL